ncbi:MAG: hypothetical protein GWN00_20980, partial [Aliifodinibius sp.]|nr:ABC transporter permease [candidate division Zixibacteria bacterium]NIT58605.1 ABC transporter permease [Fodinibius sp.]NIS47023.1 ABC transporter permease [candidate division Zixibacteria bacterium]NIU15171.1 ABC transporter permease [candidate division Zixibacteria bacterium]NIV07222.1 hypothetical protein [candidate division Zixibacteria bacterium]
MIKNYFKIAFRNLVKQKGYSIINIIGLAVGMASCLLILLWVQDELRYDKFHSKSERIYRLVDDYTRSGNTLEMAVTSGPMGPTLVREFPEVIDAVRMTNIGVVVN